MAVNIIKKIGLLTSSSKSLIQLLESHFAKSSYQFHEIKFDASYLKDQSQTHELNTGKIFIY